MARLRERYASLDLQGASFLELCVVCVVALVVLGPIVVSFSSAVRTTDHTLRRLLAVSMATLALERNKGLPLAQLERLFGPGSTSGKAKLAADKASFSDLWGQAFEMATDAFELDATFTVIEPGRLGLLEMTCEYVTLNGGKRARVKVGKVVCDFVQIGWGRTDAV